MCSFVFREFEVEGEPQLEVRGQGPVWRTRLSPDSACSEVSAGSLEQQHDAGQPSVSVETLFRHEMLKDRSGFYIVLFTGLFTHNMTLQKYTGFV